MLPERLRIDPDHCRYVGLGMPYAAIASTWRPAGRIGLVRTSSHVSASPRLYADIRSRRSSSASARTRVFPTSGGQLTFSQARAGKVMKAEAHWQSRNAGDAAAAGRAVQVADADRFAANVLPPSVQSRGTGVTRETLEVERG